MHTFKAIPAGMRTFFTVQLFNFIWNTLGNSRIGYRRIFNATFHHRNTPRRSLTSMTYPIRDIHLGTYKLKAYTINGTRTVYLCLLGQIYTIFYWYTLVDLTIYSISYFNFLHGFYSNIHCIFSPEVSFSVCENVCSDACKTQNK